MNLVSEPFQWNPITPDNSVPLWANEFIALHPECKVRPTSYGEVFNIIGTSGCSSREPWWTWSVMGVLETERGTIVVDPNDWVLEVFPNIFVVLTDAEYKNYVLTLKEKDCG